MVKINKIEQTACLLYNPSGELVGGIDNYLSLLDVRVQIKKLQVTGYEIRWNGQNIRIDRNGELDKYPLGFFEETTNLLMKLI